jgi:acid phosphatase family membrane protein YuiD
MQALNAFVYELLNNYPLMVASTAWLLAQSIKIVIYYFKDGHIDFCHFFEAGGMPSAHSATVSALALSCGLRFGFGSPFFATALVLALIVMYDATGVRQAAGNQALVLNRIMDDIYNGGVPGEKRLKEMMGHTPPEVYAGATIGVLTSLLAWSVFIR